MKVDKFIQSNSVRALTTAVCTHIDCSMQECAAKLPAVTPGEKERRVASEAKMEAKVTMMRPVTRVTAYHVSSACHVLSLGHTRVSHCSPVSHMGMCRGQA